MSGAAATPASGQVSVGHRVDIAIGRLYHDFEDHVQVETAMDHFTERLLKTIDTFLARWNGGHATIWEYRKSHSALTIRITKPGQSGNLHISCLGPDHIRGPFSWSDCELKTSKLTTDASEPWFVLEDRRVDFRLTTETIEVAENCKPL